MLVVAALRIRVLWNGGMEDEDSYVDKPASLVSEVTYNYSGSGL